jgi:hypothetical protein
MDASDILKWIAIIILLILLAFVGYLILYQIGKNKQQNQKLLRLQVFHKLISHPGTAAIDDFYACLHKIKDTVIVQQLSIEDKENINNLYKQQFSLFRKSFVEELLQIDRKLGRDVLVTMDELLDAITDAMFERELNHLESYETYIGAKILDSKRKLIRVLCNYKGQ